jgi:hypothetical protein
LKRAGETVKRSIQAAALLAATAAAAYILPPESILRRAAEARDNQRLSALEVGGSASFYNEAQANAAAAVGAPASGPELQTDARFAMRVPGRCRAELLVDAQSKAAVVTSQGQQRSEGHALPELAVGLEEACALLGARSNVGGEALADLGRHLKARKIDWSQVALGRFAGQVVYMLGAANGPQFWVYKDSFEPARIRFSEAGASWDVRFLDYGGPITGEAFPRQIEVVKGDALEVRFSALSADTRPHLAETLF